MGPFHECHCKVRLDDVRPASRGLSVKDGNSEKREMKKILLKIEAVA